MITNDELTQISAKLYVPAHKSESVFDVPVSDLYDMVEELQRLRSIVSEIKDLLEE